jgi:hypothetical protein
VSGHDDKKELTRYGYDKKGPVWTVEEFTEYVYDKGPNGPDWEAWEARMRRRMLDDIAKMKAEDALLAASGGGQPDSNSTSSHVNKAG